MGRLRPDLCQHALDRHEYRLGLVNLDKVPRIRNDLVVTPRGELSIGVMPRRERLEK
jgi:hypothetical protein